MTDIFISDLHLSKNRPDLYKAFSQFLAELGDDTEQLYILGDLFEYWIGDDYQDEIITQVKSQLRLLANRRIRLFFQPGNRDFLLSKRFAEQCGMTILPDHYLYEYRGKRALLMHGDLLCTDDVSYQRFRGIMHSPVAKSLCKCLPMFARRRLAMSLRKKSAQATGKKAAEILDVNQKAVVSTMRRFDVRYLIHGHTHRPAVHTFEDTQIKHRYVLGDWDKDMWWISCNSSGFSLQKLSVS